MKIFNIKLLLLSLILLAGFYSNSIFATPNSNPSPQQSSLALTDIKIGVLAFRSHSATRKHWQPLIDYLNQQIPEYNFRLETFYEFELSNNNKFHFIYTNPKNFAKIKERLQLTPLATVTSLQDGQPLSEFGGVIFTRQDRDDIYDLGNLKHLKIAAPFQDSLGGFIAQQFEILQSSNKLDIKNVHFTGMPHDNVVKQVLSRKADVGFVRTGILEEMAKEQKIQLHQIKVLNPQSNPLFPLATSTRLFPEWPFSACAANPADLNKQVTAALLSIKPTDKIAQDANIYGFSLPKDYQMVKDALVQLGLKPNQISFWQHLYERHFSEILILIILTAFGLLSLISYLLYNYVQLRHTATERDTLNQSLKQINADLERIIEVRTAEIVESNLKFQQMFEHHASPMMLIDPDSGQVFDVNQAAINFYGYSESQMKQMNIYEINMLGKEQVTIERRRAALEERNYFIFPHKLKSGEIRHIEVHSSPVTIEGKSRLFSIIHDITKRVKAQESLKLHDTALNYAANAIAITDKTGEIIWANKAYGDLTGFLPTQYIGRQLNEVSISSQADRDLFDQIRTLVSEGEKWHGIVQQTHQNGDLYQVEITISPVRNDKYEVTNFIAVMQDVTLRIEAEQQIQSLAFYDSLTKLPNRRLLLDRLNIAMKQTAHTKVHGAVIYLDLDHFKVLNDAHGHKIGDKLLFKTAKRLKRTLSSLDTVARFGGDEFIILLNDLSQDAITAGQQAVEIAHKIKLALDNKPFYLELDDSGTILEHKISASMGVTLFQGHKKSVDDILKWTEMAMYQAKASGRNEIRLFDPNMQVELDTRIKLEQDLRKAIENNGLALHYQPQVDQNGRILGAEALIRWPHPEHGLVPPIEFIPLAEESGLIVMLGDWVLETAISQIKQWSTDKQLCTIQLSINISAKQLYQVNFVNQVKSLIDKYQINPLMLKLELTESVLLNHKQASIKKMNALREIGIQFSMDDFGTGYSSLSYLKQLPFSQIKIDQSFVQDLGVDHTDEAMVQAIMTLGTSFEMSVVAEGVETQEQFQILQSYNCKLFQGYFFSKPLPLNDFINKVKTS